MKSVFLKLLKHGWSESLAVKTSYFTHQVSYLNLEGEGSSFKIGRFISHFISNLKWAWQAHFLSHTPETLENQISLQDVQMILVPFFEIPYGNRLAKNVKSRCVQIIPRSTAYHTSALARILSKYLSPAARTERLFSLVFYFIQQNPKN